MTTAAPELFGGLETGGTWCVCAVGSGPDSIIARTRLPTTDPPQTLARIIDFFRRHPTPAAIGIGSFGPAEVDARSPDWGAVTTTPKPGWSDVPVGPVLERELGVPVCFDTDVAAAAIGERRWGAGRGVESLCYMTVGTGVGVGLLLHGRPWHGIVHPEVGHMRIPHDRAIDPFAGICPYHGDCLEGLAAGPAIAARWGRPAQELEPGHPGWELEAGYLAAALTNIVLTVGPQRIVLGGGVLDHPGLLEMIRAHVEQMLGSYLRAPALDGGLLEYLVAPALGDDAGVLGAISMAQEHIGLRAD
jgi:fructokinase